MKPIRAAVVGVGGMGQHHARILSQMSDVQLAAVADLTEGVPTTRLHAVPSCRPIVGALTSLQRGRR